MSRGKALSPMATEVIRTVSDLLLDEPADVLTDQYEAVFGAIRDSFRSEPSLSAEVVASTRGNIRHWAASMHREPGGPVVESPIVV